jgi:monoamine oxidase
MDNYDILIVGAGIAGLHCALRLSSRFPKKKIAITDSANYIGGRIYTYTPPENKKIHWEAGAGRINNTHKLTIGYVNKYGLTQIPINSQPNWISKDTKLIETNKWSSFIKTLLNSVSKIPKSILATHTLQEILELIYQKSIVEKLLALFPYRAEVITLRADMALRSFSSDMSPNSDFFVIKEGFHSMVDSMKKELESKNVTILQNHKCISLHSKDIIPMMCHFKTPNGLTTLSANKIILAIPAESLRKLSHFKSYPILKHIQSSPLLRIYTVFPKNSDKHIWFEHMKATLVTDSPLRYIIPVNSKAGVIMSSYTDGKDTLHWETLKERGMPFVNKEIMSELRTLFPEINIPNPLYFKYHYWEHGANYWVPGLYNPIKESNDILQPFPTRLPDVYVCGESYSLKQAWVEGALEHAEQLLTKYFWNTL